MDQDRKKQAIDVAWRIGQLRYKLQGRQMWVPVYDKIRMLKGGETFVIESGRRTGKSSLLLLLAVEFALRNPRTLVGYIAPVREKLTEFIQPILFDLLRDCPADIRPEFMTKSNTLVFKNGSKILFAGSNNKSYVTLRGFKLAFLACDEIAFIDNLDFALDQVLRPALFDSNGVSVMSSTPPPGLDHPFIRIADRAIEKGLHYHGTVYDAGYPAERIKRFEEECLSHADFEREYLAKRIVDPLRAIVPEWDDKYIVETPRDEFFQFYQYVCSMDMGWNDFTVVLWMYWDFKRAQLVVEDELTIDLKMAGNDTARLTQLIKGREEALLRGLKPVANRVADVVTPIILNDMSKLHGIHFYHPSKDKLEPMVNELRMLASKGALAVNPKCKILAGTLKGAIWNERRTEFDRSGTFGHADAIAALIYGMRSINQQGNPVPPLHGLDTRKMFIPDHLRTSSAQVAFGKAFNLKPKRKI